MRPNPTPEEVHEANRRAQSRDDDALSAANVSAEDARDAVETIDRIDGVKMAFRRDESPKVHARVDGVGAICGIKANGYTVTERDRDADGTLVAIVDLSDDVVGEDDAPTCPECGSGDVKEGACPDPTRPSDTADFGCRECGHLWDE